MVAAEYTVKTKFKECMSYLYPKGLREEDYNQHRDLIKCFVMGWATSIDIRGNQREVDVAIEVVEEIIKLDELNPDWKPDSSWRWW